MGYYTNYTLNADGFDDKEAAEFFEFKLLKLSQYSGWEVNIEKTVSGYSVEAAINDVKWYDWQSNLEQLTEQYPQITITVDGVGEEPGDIWRARVQNGETKRAKATISFPELD